MGGPQQQQASSRARRRTLFLRAKSTVQWLAGKDRSQQRRISRPAPADSKNSGKDKTSSQAGISPPARTATRFLSVGPRWFRPRAVERSAKARALRSHVL